MKAIVTCGPISEPIDQVRRLASFFTGKFGVHLSDQLARAGYEAFCLKGSVATYPGLGEHLAQLPAIRWKLQNLAKLKKSNPTEFVQQADELRMGLAGRPV